MCGEAIFQYKQYDIELGLSYTGGYLIVRDSNNNIIINLDSDIITRSDDGYKYGYTEGANNISRIKYQSQTLKRVKKFVSQNKKTLNKLFTKDELIEILLHIIAYGDE